MVENARNNLSIDGDNVENPFAAIAVMLIVTVIPNALQESALPHSLLLLMCNTKDFAKTGVPAFNPLHIPA